jgi:hypothetical protein
MAVMSGKSPRPITHDTSKFRCAAVGTGELAFSNTVEGSGVGAGEFVGAGVVEGAPVMRGSGCLKPYLHVKWSVFCYEQQKEACHEIFLGFRTYSFYYGIEKVGRKKTP